MRRRGAKKKQMGTANGRVTRMKTTSALVPTWEAV
jgi:hypothetical protein